MTIKWVDKENVPLKWTNKCQISLECIKQLITTSPILAYSDPDKQYYLFKDRSKHPWSGVLLQYHEQKQEDRTKLRISLQLHIRVELSKVHAKIEPC